MKYIQIIIIILLSVFITLVMVRVTECHQENKEIIETLTEVKSTVNDINNYCLEE